MLQVHQLLTPVSMSGIMSVMRETWKLQDYLFIIIGIVIWVVRRLDVLL